MTSRIPARRREHRFPGWRQWVGLLLFAAPLAGSAQGIRLSGVSSAQLIELRPLLVDAAGKEYSGALINAAPFLQDLTLAAWGLGEGFSLHANARIRTQLASDGLVYPRANDHLDVLDVYAELDRPSWRGRLGRQWVTGGLGAYDFDGANLLMRRGSLAVEAWGGRALAAGLYERYAGPELAAVEDRPPRQDGYLVGARARLRPNASTSMTMLYQRVLVADSSGLYAERASFDATVRGRSEVLSLSAAYDFATGDLNEGRIRLATAMPGAFGYAAELRHSQPFFELWTIWGAFAPVGFDEAKASIDWRPRAAPVSLGLRAGYRRYGDANAGLDLRTDGWRAGAEAMWTGEGAISASASYDVDIGFGASRNDGRIRMRWSSPTGSSFGVEGSALQNIYEFRVGTGRVLGATIDGTLPISPDVRVAADMGLYRHTLTTGAVGPDWTQRRASVRLEWTLGRDPGVTRGKTP